MAGSAQKLTGPDVNRFPCSAQLCAGDRNPPGLFGPDPQYRGQVRGEAGVAGPSLLDRSWAQGPIRTSGPFCGMQKCPHGSRCFP